MGLTGWVGGGGGKGAALRIGGGGGKCVCYGIRTVENCFLIAIFVWREKIEAFANLLVEM